MERLKNYRRLALWVVACRADSTGTVSNGPFGKPVVKYTMDQTDMAKLRAGAVEVARHHFAAGAKAVMPGVLGVPYELHEKDLHLLENASLDPRAWTSILTHLFGGCPMGANPDVGLCDPRGRVFGYEGLVVADASVMPTRFRGKPPTHHHGAGTATCRRTFGGTRMTTLKQLLKDKKPNPTSLAVYLDALPIDEQVAQIRDAVARTGEKALRNNGGQ